MKKVRKKTEVRSPSGDGKPEKGDGFAQVAHELDEALSLYSLSGLEARIIRVVIRLTYGYQRKFCTIPFNEFIKRTGIGYKESMSRAMGDLIEKNILIKNGTRPGTYGINKYYKTWKNWGEDYIFLEKQVNENVNLNKDLVNENVNQQVNQNVNLKGELVNENVNYINIGLNKDNINISPENSSEETFMNQFKFCKKFLHSYNSWCANEGLDGFEVENPREIPKEDTEAKNKLFATYAAVKKFNKYMSELGIPNTISDFAEHPYIKWFIDFFIIDENYSMLKTFGFLHERYLDLFKEYWSLVSSSFLADKYIVDALNLYYAINPSAKKYRITGYTKAYNEIVKLVSYPLVYPYINYIIKTVVKKGEDVWEIGNMRRWLKEGLLRKSVRSLDKNYAESNEVLIKLLNTAASYSSGNVSSLRSSFNIDGKTYNTKEELEKYGFNKYWKE